MVLDLHQSKSAWRGKIEPLSNVEVDFRHKAFETSEMDVSVALKLKAWVVMQVSSF